MEVRNIGQGGQVSFDNIGTKVDRQKSAEGEAVYVPNIPVAQTQTGEKVQSQDALGQHSAVNEKELKDALDKLSKFIENDNTQIEYQYHSKFNDLMIKIINKDTKEVILEVPPKRILDLVAKMMEMVGVLFDKKA